MSPVHYDCLVGRYIQPTLKGAFGKIQDEAKKAMAKMTLAECIKDMRKQAKADGLL